MSRIRTSTPAAAAHPGRPAPRNKGSVQHPGEVPSKNPDGLSGSMDEQAQRVARHVAEGRPVTPDVAKDDDAEATFGQRAADVVASFGGSWIFVGLFAGGMVVWVWLNAILVASRGRTFDPYPYILLNLFLSMLAAIQAPVILMSQNRHSERERLRAEHDYEVNLQAEADIMLLHEKVDLLREQQWAELLALQKEQLELLATLIKKQPLAP